MKLVLGSNSPRRKEILNKTGYDFIVQKSSIDENIEGELLPADIVSKLALKKARAVIEKLTIKEDAAIIGADTLVVFKEEILGKPQDASEAYLMLSKLKNSWHEVYTGIAVVGTAGGEYVFYEKTKVHMKNYDDKIIWDYIKTKEPLDKAGAYGIQGKGAFLVDKIEGDYLNVVGLPLTKLGEILAEKFGITPF